MNLNGEKDKRLDFKLYEYSNRHNINHKAK